MFKLRELSVAARRHDARQAHHATPDVAVENGAGVYRWFDARPCAVASSAKQPMVLFATGINHRGGRTRSAFVTGDWILWLTPRARRL